MASQDEALFDLAQSVYDRCRATGMPEDFLIDIASLVRSNAGTRASNSLVLRIIEQSGLFLFHEGAMKDLEQWSTHFKSGSTRHEAELSHPLTCRAAYAEGLMAKLEPLYRSKFESQVLPETQTPYLTSEARGLRALGASIGQRIAQDSIEVDVHGHYIPLDWGVQGENAESALVAALDIQTTNRNIPTEWLPPLDQIDLIRVSVNVVPDIHPSRLSCPSSLTWPVPRKGTHLLSCNH